MKTVEEILQYIETFYQVALEEPKFFFRDVSHMESELSSFEALHEFIVDDSRKYPSNPTCFGEFMLDNDYGTLGFEYGKSHDDEGEPIDRPPMKAPSDDEIARMNEFAALFREFLSSGRRLRPNPR